MTTRHIHKILITIMTLFCFWTVHAQMTPWAYWTLLPKTQMDEIIGEASGETAWNTIIETGGYNKNRQQQEYEGTFYETQYIIDQLKLYGMMDAEIVRYPGGKVWDGVKGELWEVSPRRQKIASYQDMTAMLASGSTSADVTAELVWVGSGAEAEIDSAEVAGKIVVTEGRMSTVHTRACLEGSALGVVAISQSRPDFDPLQIPWSGVRSWRSRSDKPPKFGFHLPFREGQFLKRRLLRGETITVRAQVESRMESYDLQNIVCTIPGADPDADEIIFSAHLFEGIVKQGANDNKSGSATILEVARTLYSLISDGRLPRPKRTIRFLWGPEISGTGEWVKAHPEIMNRTLCNINMDMVGEWLSKNKAYFCLMRTTFGNAHYINDVMENYYRFVGEGNRERIQNRSNFDKIPCRIVAPTGADEPFPYAIETHYGASDHEVFNDWSVRVPGVMMIAWPDQWYHTSGDRVDKADPTQLKRVAVIGAAAAYTIASADDAMAIRIASETESNGTRRLGHHLAVALDKINVADSETLDDAYKSAAVILDVTVENEIATLETIKELAEDVKSVGSHIKTMQESIRKMGNLHAHTLKTHMEVVAQELGRKPAQFSLTSEEKQAAKLVPTPTSRVKEEGYMGFRGLMTLMTRIPESVREQYPVDRSDLGNASELHALINGKRNTLDIYNFLQVQSSRPVKLESVVNYLHILESLDLITL